MKNLCKTMCVLLIGIIALLFVYYMQGNTYRITRVKNERDRCVKTKFEYSKCMCGEMIYQHDDSVYEEGMQHKMSRKDQYLCIEVEDGYEVTLYNHSNQVISSTFFPKEPRICWVTDDILEISISVGSPAVYSYYFNTKSLRISETYFNPIIVGDRYIAYMENHEELILRDIFHESLLEMRIKRNFSQTANPISAIQEIKMTDNENIILTYFTGSDYTEVSEKISLKQRGCD